jgi:hypothetical protein
MKNTGVPQKRIRVRALYIISPALQGVLALFLLQLEHAHAGAACALMGLASMVIGAAKVSVIWK